MLNRNESDAGIDARLRTMRILWAAFVASIAVYALIAYLVAPVAEACDTLGEESPLIYIFFALGLSSVAASYALRQNFYGKAEREGQPALVQTGLIVALALSEVAALLGLVALFVLRNPLAYSLFALAVIGHLLHFPQRNQLLAAARGAGRTI